MAIPKEATTDESKVRPYYLQDDGTLPNSRIPLLVYPTHRTAAR